MIFKIKSRNLFIVFIIFLTFFGFSVLEEGMFPLSEINKLDLKKAGLKIPVRDIYNPGGISLVDALVDVGGCTGSFISENGLILTNHHCTFSAVQALSSLENDYVTKGFHAKSYKDELPIKGMQCKIILGYSDVSKEILESISHAKDYTERIQLLTKKTKEIIKRENEKDSNYVTEISEMFMGQTYVLFKFKVFKDIRLVYVPPRNIGDFGGDEDNWEWPRHNGDFSIIRAYASKDQKASGFSEENVPYKPKNFLKINKKGIKKDDFVFILGYPGRTYRHYPSEFIKYHKDILLPYTSDLYSWQISELVRLSKNDKKKELEFSARIKSLANVEKNYRGKIQGLQRINILEKIIDEESSLHNFISKDKKLTEKYGNTLNKLNEMYSLMYKEGKRNLIINNIFRASSLITAYSQLYDYILEIKKPDSERKSQYKEINKEKTKEQIRKVLNGTNKEVETLFLTRLFNDGLTLDKQNRIFAVDEIEKLNFDKFLSDVFSTDEYRDMNSFNNYFSMDQFPSNNSFLKFIKKLKDQQIENDEANQSRQGAINKYSADLFDVKKIWKKGKFIPDANSTLRLTYGYVKGYSPSDAIYLSPFTTIKGMIEKSIKGGVYQINGRVRELYDKKVFGEYKNKEIDDLSIAFLYNMDTTGGNSGSPVLDCYGNLIGLNFDRAFGATINDYAWNENYSRSIGVDIRFILWVLDKVSGAQNIVNELSVN